MCCERSKSSMRAAAAAAMLVLSHADRSDAFPDWMITRGDVRVLDADKIEPRLGSVQREPLSRAIGEYKDMNLDRADEIVEPVLKFFRMQMTDDKARYISVPSRDEHARFVKENPDAARVVWLDFSFQA